MWELILVLSVVVIGVVAFLLNAILTEAKTIEAGAKAIWDGGKRIANNTVHVPELQHTNVLIERILSGVPNLHADLERVHHHAETCPGCPKCVVGGLI